MADPGLEEKIAHAIASAEGHQHWDRIPNTEPDLIPGETTSTKDDYFHAARAVIAVLARPENISDEMMMAFDEVWMNNYVHDHHRAATLRRAIAAALAAGGRE